MNGYLEEINIWLALSKLFLNITKTVHMTFGIYCDSDPDDISVSIQGVRLSKVKHCNYLRIVFDFNLKWAKHIENN